MKENKPLKNGYETKKFSGKTLRFCQTLELKNDAKLIEEYKLRHSPDKIWSEIPKGIKDVGILDMEIYLFGTKLFMIVETDSEFDWDKAFAKLDTLPRQKEWEEYMAIFQLVKKGATSAEKWQLMERIFTL